MNPICSGVHGVSTTNYFFLHCPHYTCVRQTLVNRTNNLDSIILEHHESFITNTLLLVNKDLNFYISKSIIMCTIAYTLSTQGLRVH